MPPVLTVQLGAAIAHRLCPNACRLGYLKEQFVEFVYGPGVLPENSSKVSDQGPPVVPHLGIKAFLATRSGPSCVEENVFIARTRDLTRFRPRSTNPRGVMRGCLCRVPKPYKLSARSPE